MRPEDRTRILHMIEAAETVADFVAGGAREDLDSDRMLLFALVRVVEVLGEAAAKVSPEMRSAAAGIPWPQIVAMRNRLMHAYFDVNPDIPGRPRPRKFPRCCRRFAASSAFFCFSAIFRSVSFLFMHSAKRSTCLRSTCLAHSSLSCRSSSSLPGDLDEV